MSDDLLDQLAAYGHMHRLHQESVTVTEVAEHGTGLPTVVERQLHRRPRRSLIAAAVGVAAVLLIAGVAAGVVPTWSPRVRGPSSPPQTAPVAFEVPTTRPGDTSSTGPVLPEGAVSTPAVGERVASVLGWYAVYADGRLISLDERDNRPFGSYLEQRLTPEGVERVRLALLASGEFNGAATKSPDNSGCTCVRADDGRLLAASISQERGEQLVSMLRALLASLPESDWAEQQAKPYVASRVSVCVGAYLDVPDKTVGIGVPRDPSELVPLLPGRAPELFSGLTPVADPAFVMELNRENVTCYEMTMDEARGLADQLLGPSVGGTISHWAIVLRDPRLKALTADPTDEVVAAVGFRGLMPDGASGP